MILTHDDYLTAVETATEAAQAYYHTGVELMSDFEYDVLVIDIDVAGKTFDWHEGDTVVNAVAAGTAPADVTITHATPMLSLDKLSSVEELRRFVALIGEKNVVLEPKLDGTALSVVYRNGVLFSAAGRGTGLYANDLTSKVMSHAIKGLPKTLNTPVDIEVRGELYITDADFVVAQAGRAARNKKLFSNSRNAVAGAMNDEKDNSYIQITFGAYEALGLTDNSYRTRMGKIAGMGFLPAVHLMPATLDKAVGIEAKIEAFRVARPELGLLTDGIVLKCDDYKMRASMGEGNHGPRYNKAWKFNADEMRGTTTILEIMSTIGKSGRWSPRARLQPVMLDTLISYVSLHNVKWIEERDIRVGSSVVMLRRNGVIPYVESVVGQAEGSERWVAPVGCPKCGEPFDKTTELWRCNTPECSILGSVLYAGTKAVLDWEGFSTAIATRLVESDRVSSVADVFELTLAELIVLDSGRRTKNTNEPILLGETTATKVYNKIQASKSQPLARVITSLAIRKMGRTMGLRVANYFGTMDAVQSATVADFMNVEGVAENKAAEYVKGFKMRKNIIARLCAAGVNMGEIEAAAKVAAKKSPVVSTVQVLAGLNVCVTGAMKGTKLDGLTRDDMTALIRKNGGEFAGDVRSTTNILVCAIETSTKYKKAITMPSVKIMTPDAFAKMVGLS